MRIISGLDRYSLMIFFSNLIVLFVRKSLQKKQFQANYTDPLPQNIPFFTGKKLEFFNIYKHKIGKIALHGCRIVHFTILLRNGQY